MSMRTYGVETKGLVMTREELGKLIIANISNNKIKEYLMNNDINNSDQIDDYIIDDFITNIDFTTLIPEVVGKLYNYDDWGEKEFFDGDDIIITELKKNNLFENYKDIEEIKLEIKNTYNQIGIELDDKFIDEHFGNFSGTYWG